MSPPSLLASLRTRRWVGLRDGILIDQQLQEAGWQADSEALTWKNGIRPEKGKNIAIAEWPTRSPQLVAGCDVWVELEFLGDCQRRVTLAPRLPAGQVVVERLRGASPFDSSYKR